MTEREKLIQILSEDDAHPNCAECKTPIGHCNRCSLERHADYLIANGVTFATDNNVGRWIPVTERLPDEYQSVLVLLKSKLTVVARMVDNGWIVSWNHNPLPGVTHWMPLPEPPKEVDIYELEI